MVCDIEDIKREVRILMDKYPESRSLLDTGDVDSISVDAVIEQRIEEAARIVESSAPAYLLDSGVSFGGTIGWNSQLPGYGSGFVELPPDFMRLVTFQMSDWARPVTQAITEESPLYARQSSRFAGVRGNPERPVVAIVQNPVGLVLEFYSSTGGDGVCVRHARYIPFPKLEDGHIELCEKLIPCIQYYCAYLVCNILGEENAAARLLNISNELAK